jgi:hypothetical protein
MQDVSVYIFYPGNRGNRFLCNFCSNSSNYTVTIWNNFLGKVTVFVQLYCRWSCVLLWMFTLHVSAYMAIFKCVRYFPFLVLKESASLQQDAKI